MEPNATGTITETKGRTLSLGLICALSVLLLQPGCSRTDLNSKSGKEEKIVGDPADPAVQLRAEWAPANRYIFRFETAIRTESSRASQNHPVQQATTLAHDYALIVTNAAPGGTVELALELLSMQLDMSLGDRVLVAFDSQTVESGDSSVERMKKLVGGRIRCQLSSENKVIQMDGLESFTERVFGPESRSISGGLFRRIFSPQYFRQLVEINGLPDHAVRVSESWPVHREVVSTLSGPIAMDLTCSFRGWQQHRKAKCALLEFQGDIRPNQPPVETASSQKGIGGTLEKGSIHGRTWFDPELGLVSHTISDQTLSFRNSRLRNGTETNGPAKSIIRQHTDIHFVEKLPVEPGP